MTTSDADDALVLEPLSVDHAAEMFVVLADRQLYEYTGGEPPSIEALTARYRSQVAGPSDAAEIWRNWIIRRSGGGETNGEAIGFVQATVVGDAADVAWLVGVEHQGRGVASRAVRSMVERLADAGVRRIDAHIHRRHRSSQRVAAAIGLERTGEVDDDGEEIWRGSLTAR